MKTGLEKVSVVGSGMIVCVLACGCGQSPSDAGKRTVTNTEHPQTSSADPSNSDTSSSTASESETLTAMAVASDADENIQRWESVPPLPAEIAIFDHVFWEPLDTESLRAMIRDTELVKGRSVLEIGTGSGIVALCCLQADCRRVVATDVNPWAIRNAVYNARHLKFMERFEARLVSQKRATAWAVIGSDEKFDVILSNPPWELGKPTHIEQFGDFDPDFRLMESFVDGLPQHLNPGGRAFVAYGCLTAIRHLQNLLTSRGHAFTIHDNRPLNSLPEVFLPGMLIEIHPGK